VPFTLLHTGKYRTEDKFKIQTIKKLNTTQKKQTTQKHSKTKLAWLFSSVASYDIQSGNEGGLILQQK